MRVLLTGATGFVGGHLCRALIETGHSLTALVRPGSDLSRLARCGGPQTAGADDPGVIDALQQARFDLVIHTATNYGRDGGTLEELTRDNVTLPSMLLQAHASSGAAAPFLNTDTFFSKPGLASGHLEGYTTSKRRFLDRLHRADGEQVRVNMRLEHVFGAGDRPPKFIPTALQAFLRGDRSLPMTDGTQNRDFVAIDDVVRSYLEVVSSLERLPAGVTEYQVGRGESMQVREFVLKLRDAAGSDTDLDLGAVPERSGEIESSRADLTALSALGWAPARSLDEDIRDYVERARQEVS